MIPSHYPLRPSDGASVPAVSGVLGITSCRITPVGNQRPPWSRLTSVRGSFSPVFQPRGGGVSPPNSLPLGYKFIYRLRPFCPRSAPSVRPIRSSTRPGSPPRGGTVFLYHPYSTITNKRRPSQNPHQTLYPPPGEPIFSGAGITSGGVA